MRLGSFCTGYGGLDMAVEHHYGADLAWYSEVDKDCNPKRPTSTKGPNTMTNLDQDYLDHFNHFLEVINEGVLALVHGEIIEREGGDD